MGMSLAWAIYMVPLTWIGLMGIGVAEMVISWVKEKFAELRNNKGSK